MPTATILGTTYQTVAMPDGREWMAANLAYTGGGIVFTAGTYSPKYRNDATLAAALATIPDRWHLPTQDEWRAMGLAIDPRPGIGADLAYAGGPLKEAGTDNWASPNTGATNAYGFTALPNEPTPTGEGWWTATVDSPGYHRTAGVGSSSPQLGFGSSGDNSFLSVRLVRDIIPFFAEAHETTHALSIEWTEAADGTPIAYDDGAAYDHIESTITARLTPSELATLEAAWQSATKLYTIYSTGYLLGPLIDMSGGVEVRLMSYQVDQSADSAMTLYDVTIGVHYGPLSAPSAGSLAVVQSRGRPYHSVAPGAASWVTEGGTSDVNAYGRVSERSCTWYTHSLTTAQAADVVNALRTLRGSSTTWTAGGVATPWGPSESGTATVWIPSWSVHRESNLLWGVQMELVRNG